MLCPALPVNGRTVKDGILYVNGVPLGESPMKDHPVNPMTKSYIPDLMAPQSKYPCYSLSSKELYSDTETFNNLIKDYESKGKFTLAPDYAEDKDGREIAERFGDIPVLTGGSGLLEHLGIYYAKGNPGALNESGDFSHSAKGRLILAGSCSSMTQAQVDCYLKTKKFAVKIDPVGLIEGTQTFDELKTAVINSKGDILLFTDKIYSRKMKNV